MTPQGLDLFDPYLWGFLAFGALFLGSMKNARQRNLLFCATNLAFLTGLLGYLVLPVVAALGALWLGLRHSRPLAYGVLFVFLIGFVVRKSPEWFNFYAITEISTILVYVGFSYFFLRAIDMTRGVLEGRHPCPGFIDVVNYLLPFHMLAAGPIQAWDDFSTHRLEIPKRDFDDILAGAERIARGLFKKYVVAAIVSRVFLTGFQADGAYLILEIQFFFIWLYLDFSAYSDIAIGAGRLMGIHTPENFNRPYLARNIIEFWERWHMSLAQFVRRSIFIPLQLNLTRRWPQRPLLAATFAFTVAFLLLGLWHDISIKYFAWGGFHALGLITCNLYRHTLQKKLGRDGVKRYLARPAIRIIANIATFEFVALSLYIIA